MDYRTKTDQDLSHLDTAARAAVDRHALAAIGAERRMRGAERAALLDAVLAGTATDADAWGPARGLTNRT